MSATAVIAALAGVVVGAVLKHFFDLRASRRAKLLDEKLRYAVAFLAAADWAGRSYEAAESAAKQLGHAVTQGADRNLVDAEKRHEYHLQQGDTSLKDAHVAACALRLLMPELDTAPGEYIALSVGAESAYSPEGRRKREIARAAVEAALVKTLGTAPRRRGGTLGDDRAT
ncbi:hypothetical protein [Micromonospora sp. NPDC005305]|uniref:hypothetical protein n=1 Tax=Micromonospora sp. NPDC005305 TaxID=3156875 RepID=UPI0033A04B7F